ncbi:MAG: SDR family oxidoreductase [Rhodospirillaceae bacterium]|jgi:3-oxoacyl-[acyl-carrier protein] reductase|nr:SDR family oxidoreductase [Rhodospirillaceae bacterium]MBT6118284.1 SDR family oxidoreductase [Rhodospirillaceae bacterium]
MASLEGKVALITGSGKGMGRTHAELMARRGARIVVHDLDRPAAEEAAEALRALGGDPVLAISDISDAAATAEAIRAAEAEAGPIDILVNNAGIAGGDNPMEKIDEAAYDRMFDIHVKGAFFATKAVLPGMKARGGGKIVNIASVEGMGAVGDRAHYCGAKGALMALTKCWALEFAPWKICVNCVAPGWVLTPMVFALTTEESRKAHAEKEIPLGRYADPEEVSALVAFLCSAEADFITGQTVSPNGGQVIVGI